MRSRLLDLHLYLSLLCAPYMVVYGLSTLSFNHDWAWISPAEETRLWQEEVSRPEGDSDLAIADEMRKSLGLSGGVPPWRVQSSPEELSFIAVFPGRLNEVTWSAQTNIAAVRETRHGFWGVVRALHGSSWGWIWALYTRTSVGALIFSIITGVYLWWGRLSSRKSGLLLLLCGSCGALLFMVYIVW